MRLLSSSSSSPKEPPSLLSLCVPSFNAIIISFLSHFKKNEGKLSGMCVCAWKRRRGSKDGGPSVMMPRERKRQSLKKGERGDLLSARQQTIHYGKGGGLSLCTYTYYTRPLSSNVLSLAFSLSRISSVCLLPLPEPEGETFFRESSSLFALIFPPPSPPSSAPLCRELSTRLCCVPGID